MGGFPILGQVKVVPFSEAKAQKKLEREAAFLEKSSDENVISCIRHWSHSFTESNECASSPHPLSVGGERGKRLLEAKPVERLSQE